MLGGAEIMDAAGWYSIRDYYISTNFNSFKTIMDIFRKYYLSLWNYGQMWKYYDWHF